MSFDSTHSLPSLSGLLEELIGGNVAERIKLNPRRANIASQDVSTASGPNIAAATETPTRITIDTKLILALKQFLASPRVKLVTVQHSAEKQASEDNITATDCIYHKSFEDDLFEDNYRDSVDVEIEVEDETQSRLSSRQRSGDLILSSPKRVKTIKIVEDMKKFVMTPTKAPKKKTSPKSAVKLDYSIQDVIPLLFHKIAQNDYQPLKYHNDQQYHLTESEVIFLRPSTDRQSLAAIFNAPYKLHPFCRPFLLTQKEHTLWWKMVLEKKSAIQKENINTI